MDVTPGDHQLAILRDHIREIVEGTEPWARENTPELLVNLDKLIALTLGDNLQEALAKLWPFQLSDDPMRILERALRHESSKELRHNAGPFADHLVAEILASTK